MHIISGSDDGGARTHLINLCKYSGNLFDNIIGCINKGPLFQQASDLKLNVVVFQQRRRTDFAVNEDISKYIDQNNIDIVNFHGANPNFLHSFIKGRLKIHCVTTIHSDYRYDFINNLIKYVLFTPLNALAVRRFKNYICVSNRIKELLDKKGIEGGKYVVGNGIDTNKGISTLKDKIRARYNISQDAFVYTMVARMHPIKNHMGLIEAFSKLVKEFEDVVLLFVGSGDYEQKIKNRVKELNLDKNIIFSGKQENSLDYINAGNINILTSLSETFPIVILEGGLVKKAAICSDVGDIKKIIKNNTGFLIDPNSTEDIYLKMKEAYIKRVDLDKMGETLHDIIIKEYSLERFWEKYYNAYKDILIGDGNG